MYHHTVRIRHNSLNYDRLFRLLYVAIEIRLSLMLLKAS
nr:MAG TPA: hypothetical protein [Caudoviricetes sp.]DAS75917.1 MAG TPA: hypothetical protein [Caudoviricetes sp.]DAS82284.1 MAG TPA: hypothetical protein [Caudoviricetes sp.]